MWRALVLSTLATLWAVTTAAHELRPAVADVRFEGDSLAIEIDLNLEALLAGIDLSQHDDTTQSPEAADYDVLRLETPQSLETRLREAWPDIANGLTIRAGETTLPVSLGAAAIPEVGDTDLPRDSRIALSAALPPGTDSVVVGWSARFGPLVLRQAGVEDGYTAYLTGGDISDQILRDGGGAQSSSRTFFDYVVIGFEHIVPKGLDHILFVLGLFFLSLHLKPLLLQVSAFTVAHTITLALGILGLVTIPASIVEPLIAASIVYVGVENVLSRGLTPWRPVIVFAFGLLHGLGFASVLGDIGLNPATFATGLIGFNVGVELGQLAVIALAFATVGFWFGNKPWYQTRIANPASIAIALVGAWWFVERTLL